MQQREVSFAVRPIEWPLGVKWLISISILFFPVYASVLIRVFRPKFFIRFSSVPCTVRDPVHVILLFLITLIFIIFWKVQIMEGLIIHLSAASLRPVICCSISTNVEFSSHADCVVWFTQYGARISQSV